MKKILFVSSAGGHYSELLKVIDCLSNIDADRIICTEKTKNVEKNKEIKYFLKYGTRAKLVSYLFIFILNFFKSIYIVLKENPDIVVSTGAHTCVPFILLCKILKKKTVYIESFAKVKSPSLTYKLIEKYVDEVIVQHEEMLEVYPKAKYIGGIY